MFPSFKSFPKLAIQPTPVPQEPDAPIRPPNDRKKKRKIAKAIRELREEATPFGSMDYYLDRQGDFQNPIFNVVHNTAVPQYKRYSPIVFGTEWMVLPISDRQVRMILKPIRQNETQFKSAVMSKEAVKFEFGTAVELAEFERLVDPDLDLVESKHDSSGIEYQIEAIALDRKIQLDRKNTDLWMQLVDLQTKYLPKSKQIPLKVSEKQLIILEKSKLLNRDEALVAKELEVFSRIAE